VLEGHPCLVVGGGAIAARKATALLEAAASVTMVAPRFSPAATALPLRRAARPYRSGEAAEFHLVIAATGVAEVDAAVAADAEGAGVLVNVADDPEHCSFILPAVHREGHLSVAVSTDGYSPALASWLRDHLAADLGGEMGPLTERVAALRQALLAAGAASEGRDWRALIDSLATAAAPDAVAAEWLERQLTATVRG